MSDLRTRLKETIARLVKAIEEDCKREGMTDIHLKAHPPANESEIEKYERYLQMKLPPSYREFLKLHNGYDWLAFPGDMLAIKDVMPKGKWYEPIQEWKRMSAMYGGGQVLSGIVIAKLAEPNDHVYLDPNKPSTGKELTVVKDSSSYSTEYPDLLAYFEYVISVCNVSLPPREKKNKKKRDKKNG